MPEVGGAFCAQLCPGVQIGVRRFLFLFYLGFICNGLLFLFELWFLCCFLPWYWFRSNVNELNFNCSMRAFLLLWIETHSILLFDTG